MNIKEILTELEAYKGTNMKKVVEDRLEVLLQRYISELNTSCTGLLTNSNSVQIMRKLTK